MWTADGTWDWEFRLLRAYSVRKQSQWQTGTITCLYHCHCEPLLWSNLNWRHTKTFDLTDEGWSLRSGIAIYFLILSRCWRADSLDCFVHRNDRWKKTNVTVWTSPIACKQVVQIASFLLCTQAVAMTDKIITYYFVIANLFCEAI